MTDNKTAACIEKKPVKAEIAISRIFNESRELVWKFWTDPELIRRWWGPKDYTAPESKIDLRVGGNYHYCMRSPDGRDFWSTGIFKEIIPMERIVCTDSFADKEGNIVPATFYNMDSNIPLEMNLIVTFEDYGDGQTKLNLIHTGIPPGTMLDLSTQGWNESLDKLATVINTLK